MLPYMAYMDPMGIYNWFISSMAIAHKKTKKRLSCSDPQQIRQGWSVQVKPAVKPVAAVTLMLGSPNSNKTLPKEGVQKNWANQMANQMTNLMVI